MEFKEEIRCNFRSLQQYLSLAVFCEQHSVPETRLPGVRRGSTG
jgi:hypothetical protein